MVAYKDWLLSYCHMNGKNFMVTKLSLLNLVKVTINGLVTNLNYLKLCSISC